MSDDKPQIGLSWAPKIPSFTSDPMAKSTDLKGPEQSLAFQAESQLVEGLFVPPRDPLKLKKLQKKDRKDSSGSSWFDMLAPTITPEIKKDLELLKLRGVVDPKRFYKKASSNSKTLPKYFQIGTVIESNAEYFSSRLTKKERKASFAEELLSDPNVNAYRKRKVREIAEAKRPGGHEKWKKKGSNWRKRTKSKKAIL